MAQVIELQAQGGGLRLETDDGWCRCWLVDDGDRYLGADTPRVVLTRLLEHLERSDKEIAGELEGQPVRWVLTLSEEHSTLYAARSGDERLLLIQDGDAKLVGRLTISDVDWERWRQALEDAIGELEGELHPRRGDGRCPSRCRRHFGSIVRPSSTVEQINPWSAPHGRRR